MEIPTIPGEYRWLDADGLLREADRMDLIDPDLTEVITFVPELPPEPHTQADHDLLNTYPDLLMEWMRRARDNQNR